MLEALSVRPVLLGLLLLAVPLGCGSPESPEVRQISQGGFSCDLDGLCPNALICDPAAWRCIPGTPTDGGLPLFCPVPGDRQQVLFGKGRQCLYIEESTFADIVRLLGRPEEENEWGWYHYDQAYGLSFVPTDSDAPPDERLFDTIFVEAPFLGPTPEGVAVGTPRAQARELLGEPPEISDDGLSDYYNCRGAWLHFDADEKLKSFQIFRPDTIGCPP